MHTRKVTYCCILINNKLFSVRLCTVTAIDTAIVQFCGKLLIELCVLFFSFSQCVVNEFVLSIGDFVYVSNPDQPITVKQYEIVKITHLYEIIDPLSLDYKDQAIVESYRR